jgi:hypothetical protein
MTVGGKLYRVYAEDIGSKGKTFQFIEVIVEGGWA